MREEERREMEVAPSESRRWMIEEKWEFKRRSNRRQSGLTNRTIEFTAGKPEM